MISVSAEVFAEAFVESWDISVIVIVITTKITKRKQNTKDHSSKTLIQRSSKEKSLLWFNRFKGNIHITEG